ncbi:nitrogen regulation protein NR(II) [Bradyrhizobium lablabi]|uniref:two-component system sensor histidine kinase NtrB n=1 Tax=Bradyrhizobium lablabi TaxID=722472 RepID=UPI001BAE4381|nr:ATP-binding protein [Bradyrhizobium lablabi]MBR0695762.1 ATP-binding protein [Bradyrhizobium lablabi]
MQIKETPDVSFPGAVKSPPLEDVVVLADSAGVSLGVQRAFSARVRSVHDDSSGVIVSRCVEIPLVGRDGEISGVLCRTAPRSDSGVFSSRGLEGVRAIGDVAQFVVHDINNLLAVIDSGLRLLERQSDAAYRMAIVSKMRHAITRGALLSRQFLDTARPCPASIGGFVAGSRLAALAGTLDQALRPDVAVRTEIAPDLWDFNADSEQLYFALLNLCRNAADAMPNGGTITVAARNVEPSAGAVLGFVEIVVADDGEGMTEEVLSQAFTPYFTTKAAGSGTGLGLAQVRRFAEGRGGAIGMESERGAGTLVRLFLPRVGDAAVGSSIVGAEIAYTPSPNGGAFHVVNPATGCADVVAGANTWRPVQRWSS